MTHPTILVVGNQAYEPYSSHSGLDFQNKANHRLILAGCMDEVYGFDFSKIPAVVICRAEEDSDEAYTVRKEQVMLRIDRAVEKLLLQYTPAYKSLSEQGKADAVAANRPIIVEVNAGSRMDQKSWEAKRNVAVQDAIAQVDLLKGAKAATSPAIREHVEQERQAAISGLLGHVNVDATQPVVVMAQVSLNPSTDGDPNSEVVVRAVVVDELQKPQNTLSYGDSKSEVVVPAVAFEESKNAKKPASDFSISGMVQRVMQYWFPPAIPVAVAIKSTEKGDVVPSATGQVSMWQSFRNWVMGAKPGASADKEKTVSHVVVSSAPVGTTEKAYDSYSSVRSNCRYETMANLRNWMGNTFWNKNKA